MAKSFQYYFEWDRTKARSNHRKHGISFDRAATIFLDPHMLSEYDEQHSEQEERWITMGVDHTGVVLVVCHTFEEMTRDSAIVRLISARKATKAEISQYRKA